MAELPTLEDPMRTNRTGGNNGETQVVGGNRSRLEQAPVRLLVDATGTANVTGADFTIDGGLITTL